MGSFFSYTFAPDFEQIDVPQRGVPRNRESLCDSHVQRVATRIQAEHKTIRIMSKINLEVIDQFFSAQVAANESKERIEALRPQVEEAVQELIAERGLPRSRR